jgi:methionine-rich copper-binding protein CopC
VKDSVAFQGRQAASKRNIALTALLCLAVVGCSPGAQAQHSHGALTPGVTFPKDDSVLRDPPRTITLSFRVDVRLLQLALYNAEQGWVNIGFRFEPDLLARSFVYPLPDELPQSAYYLVRWSVADQENRLLNGEFSFAFGPGAVPPSETFAARDSGKVEALPTTGAYRYRTAPP